MKSLIEEHRCRLLALVEADLAPRLNELHATFDAESDHFLRQEINRDREEIVEYAETVEQVLEYLASLEVKNHNRVVAILAEGT